MSRSIYQLWMIRNQPSIAAYETLSEAQQKAVWEAQEASTKRVGAKNLLSCECDWANEAYAWWGITEFPDVAARIEHTHDLQKMGWFRFTNAFSVMGIADIEPKPVTFPNPIYQLWLIRNNPTAVHNRSLLSKDEEAAAWAIHNSSLERYGSFVWLACDSFWCDEEHPAFGINVYPSMEAEQFHKAELAKIGWGKYTDSFTLLGIPGQE
jgi:hypothetical protein